MVPLKRLSNRDTPILAPRLASADGSVAFSWFCDKSSNAHESKPLDAGPVTVQPTFPPHADGSEPFRALRDSRMTVVVRSSRNWTGTEPLSPAVVSGALRQSELMPPICAVVCGTAEVVPAALPSGLPSS